MFAGEPGIGKTALWEAAAAKAAAAGHVLLIARPSQAERDLPYAGLVDLLAGLSLDDVDDLPEPQHRALAAALMREEARGDSLAVALGLRHVLNELSRAKPLIVAVDDIQWLDQPSARALDSALRRLADSRVSLLASIRAKEIADAGLLDVGGLGERVRLTTVESVGPSDLARLLQERLELVLAPPSIARLAELTGGNPLHALELARALPAGRRLTFGEQPELSSSLVDLLEQRLRSLSDEAARLVAAAAALARPSTEDFDRVGPGRAEAVAAGVITVDADRVRFSHPMLATAALRLLDSHTLQALHRGLADLVGDPVERALQLALGTPAPNAGVANELETAAKVAAARGAPDAAAELAERAEAASPADRDVDAARRALLAATHHLTAGDGPRARAILGRLERDLPAGAQHAEAMIMLAESDQDLKAATAHLNRARRETGAHPAVRATAHRTLAYLRFLTAEHERVERNSNAAMRLARATGDDLVYALAGSDLAFARFHQGRGLQRELAEHAIAVVERFREAESPERPERLSQPAFDLAIQLLYSDELDDARSLFERERDRAYELGDLAGQAHALLHLVEVELRAGSWSVADAMSEELLEMSGQMQMANFRPAAHYARALVDALFGREEATRSEAAEGRDLAIAAGDAIFAQANEWALGLLELSLGNAGAANEILTAAAARCERMGLVEGPPIVTDAAEAAAGARDLELADCRLARAEAWPTTAERPSRIAAIARGRAMLAAESGDLNAALASTDEALTAHSQLDEPFQHARTLFVRGGILRRAGQRSAARSVLKDAHEEFDRLGAAIWSRRAVAELGRIGGRRASGDELTPTEQRVADLVARGGTNREVAGELFVTERTVEANLTRIYRKLGVRSRTELAHRFASEGESADA
jgi:DNA-binding CsgD family transcriptional regulator